MRLRMRALVFCLLAGFLFNQDPGFGDLRLCPMVRQIEDMGCIGGIVLAETIRSLDRAALGFDDWTVSPIILQKTEGEERNKANLNLCLHKEDRLSLNNIE
ncbi:hypothetical protein JCGZ_14956 [Jatropha curcas]|uniref:Uncharacterized protein n=1 Tax=Jatropha curcas TaxID=180498 RepID=A0A067KB91_JATCU|nr:hypothetical protein JCGZ_14956 [Jatropha curcas]